MVPRALSRFSTSIWPILVIGALLLVSLALMSDATEGSAQFGELYSVLLIVNALGLLTLAGLIGWNLYQLLVQVRRRRPGARLTVRMVAVFVLLAVTPVLMVYYFSLQFLHRGIDSWFDVRVEQALEDALDLSRTALGVRMRELLKQTELLAVDLAGVAPEGLSTELENALRRSAATELTLMGTHGHIIAFSHVEPTTIVPHRPSDTILLQLRQSGSYIGLDPIGDAGLHVRVAVRLPADVPTDEPPVLQALFPVTERMSGLADSVQSAYAKYRELAYLRRPLKVSFTLTLSLVLLLSLFTAIWAAFFSARRLMAPLRDLAKGTLAVAEGDYETQLQQSSRDEVGFLVDSFNEMTRRLARARDETRRSQQRVEEQRTYLEAVLARLSTGVMTLDHEGRLFTANQAAEVILELNLGDARGETLGEIRARHPHLGALADALVHHLEHPGESGVSPAQEWREEISLFGAGGRKVLVCSATPLPGAGGPFSGHLIVFDDITALIQAQRNAAWSEVARRLAHEIKNPLTPIQLSAERLRRKYLGAMTPKDAQTMDRLTHTIVQQVESMKEMVNTFSDYARTPQMRSEEVDLNGLVSDVLELYRSPSAKQRIVSKLDPQLPPLEADPTRLRQVLHNLIKNALEAGGEEDRLEVRLETRYVREDKRHFVETRIHDSGPGFPADIVDRVFEPYVTTKPKGSGLGLAIVKKIVEEHGGVVWAENDSRGGAAVVMQFPVPSTHVGAHRIGTAPKEAV